MKDYTNMMSLKTEKRIILCPMCAGAGEVPVHSDRPGYEGPFKIDCNVCDGMGRVMQIITSKLERL